MLLWQCFRLWIITHIQSLFSTYSDDDYGNNDTQDDNTFPCFNVNSRCDSTADCCSPATCVLPAWSPHPVCLVPGYQDVFGKEELKTGDSDSNLQDVLTHIRNIYDTTTNDFLTSNLTPDPLKHVNDGDGAESMDGSTEIIVESATSRSKIIKLGRVMNHSSLDDAVETHYKLSLSSSFKKYTENYMMSSMLPDIRNVIPNTSPLSNVELKDLKFNLQKRYSFLLLSSTTRNIPKTNLSELYEGLKNSDRFKVVVRLLQENLRRLNEKEKNIRLNITSVDLEPNSMDVIKPTTKKPSKWNVLKEFVLHKHKLGDDLNVDVNTVVSDADAQQEKMIPKDMFSKLKDGIGQENDFAKKHSFLPTNQLNNYINTKKGRTFIGTFQPSKIISIGLSSVKDSDVLEYYNINVPFSIDQNNDETVFKDNYLGKQQNSSSKLRNDSKDILKQKVKANFDTLFKKYHSEISNSNTLTDKRIEEDGENAHGIKNAHFWHVEGNTSSHLIAKLKSIFTWEKQSNTTIKKQVYNAPLNERILLHFNSNNFSATMGDYLQSGQSEKTSSSEYPLVSASSIESDSSDFEDLYNNSYVFVVNKGNSSDPKKLSRLKSWLNFFSIAKTIPVPKSKNICILLPNGTCEFKSDSYEEESQNHSKVQPSPILLPESLMPEALTGRQLNDSDIMYLEDSEELGEKEIDSSSNSSTFFFFFTKKL